MSRPASEGGGVNAGGWVRAARLLGGLGGLLWIAVGILDFCIEAGGCRGGPWVVVEITALLCLLGGLGGFHRRFGGSYGRVGTAASALIALGLAWSLAATLLGLQAGESVLIWSWGYPILVVGWTLLGAVLVRRNVASRTGGVLLLSAIPLGLGTAYVSLLLLVPAFDLVVDEHVLSSGPVILYGIAWILLSESM